MNKKNLSIINSMATAMLAYFITVPGHELLHLLTYLAYGCRVEYYSAGAVQGYVPDYSVFSPFHRIMVAGGSASIINAIFGIILLIILFKVKMGPMLRLFLTQLMGCQMVQGIGYFMIGGFFAVGDWGNVFEQLTELPGLVTVLRVILSITGAGGIVALFFILNYMSYYFIEHNNDKAERFDVAFKLHLVIFIIGAALGPVVALLSPAVRSGALSLGLSLFFDLMWIPFFWAFMFTWVMVKPPKKSWFLYKLPEKPNYVLLVIGVVLVLVDILLFGPGIKIG